MTCQIRNFEEVEKLRRSFKREWELTEKLRPMIDHFAEENNLCADSLLDRSDQSVYFILANNRQRLRGANALFVLHDSEKLRLEISYDTKSRGGIYNVLSGHNGDILEFSSKRIKSFNKIPTPQYTIPPDLFEYYPREFRSLAKTKLEIDRIFELKNFSKLDLTPFDYISLDTTWSEKQIEEEITKILTEYPYMKYTISNSDIQISLTNIDIEKEKERDIYDFMGR